MDSSNPHCRVRQCFKCEESTVFFCSKCDQNLCGPCRRTHLHDLSQHTTVIPIYVIDSILWPIPSHIISTIRSEDLFKRRSLMVEIQSDLKKLNRKMPSHKHLSNMFTKAQKLKQLIDKVVNDNLLTKL